MFELAPIPILTTLSSPIPNLVMLAVVMLALVLMLDGVTRPRSGRLFGRRSLAGSLVTGLAALAALGLALAITGTAMTAAVLVAAFAGLVALVSNVKNKVLGEPLVFSDFALVGAVFQHPQFYVSALRGWQIGLIVAGFAASAALLVWSSSAAIFPRLGGLALAGAAGVLLALLLGSKRWDAMAARPDSHRDVAAHGLVAALLVHWWRWRRLPDPAPCADPPLTGQSDQLVIIVQCESFADPAELWGDPALDLPALSEARALARHAGRMMAHGFGAYTMRTEYGVLFGRGEEALGLRKFDPFLTASGEASFSLARRLSPERWTSHFVHPHDLRFYGRDRLMVQAGFTSLVGQDRFAPPRADEGRYVTDAAVADVIAELAQTADGPTLIYAVTIENHGPWPAGKGGEASGTQYLRLLRHSDAMLARLIQLARGIGRPVVLCFFGDHRPSIPGVCEPGGDRHTPYVLLDFGPDGVPRGAEGRDGRDLTPSGLHHAILDAIRSGSGER
jgi:hypothetical protein